MGTETATSVVARYFEMWNTGDTSTAESIVDRAWVDHAHPEVAGPEGVRQAVAAIRAVRPDLHFTVESILAGDDGLVAAVGGVGAQQPSPGRIIWLVRVAGGLMVEMWTYHQNPPPV
ncbi:nuclear transport factor 2 family protein [Asanoa sp. NPDC049573]|uniref:nuclear transport factor 2 family protein n=1 Tax=Asanoa sp. NPDC049573 TaxID=3155396 RepID=UPI0034204F34